MKKKSILFPLIVIITTANAQVIIPDNKIPELKKNEISINTAPLFRVLLGAGSSDAVRFSATYKRNLNEKSALRFSVVADIINHDDRYRGQGHEIILIDSNNVLIKKQSIAPGYVSPYLNVGFEKLFGNNKLRWFYGADLAIGYAENKFMTQEITLSVDSAGGSIVEMNPVTVFKSKTKAFSVGINPFFGAKYPLSKRFSISAQVGVDMKYEKQTVTTTENAKTKTSHYSVFDFNQSTGFLNNISLVYKF